MSEGKIETTFVIHGDPVGYTRMTYRQAKIANLPRVKKYFAWKDYIALEIMRQGIIYPESPTEKIYLNVMVYFRNRKHPDPENVRKGIQDAMFKQDKLVAGTVDFDYDSVNPRCEINISDTLKIHLSSHKNNL